MTDGHFQTELTKLVRHVCEEEVGQLRDKAMARLHPFIQQVALRVCRRYGADMRTTRSFVEEISGELILPRLSSGQSLLHEFDGTKGSFSGWLYRVLQHRLIDRLRKESRESHLPLTQDDSGGWLAEMSDPLGNDVASTQDWTQPFSDDDLRRIEEWHVRDRFALLVAARLWHKVPLQVRAQWSDQWGKAESVPSGAALDADEPEDRLRQLAEETGEDWLAFRQHWYRKRKRLLTLDFVRGVLDE